MLQHGRSDHLGPVRQVHRGYANGLEQAGSQVRTRGIAGQLRNHHDGTESEHDRLSGALASGQTCERSQHIEGVDFDVTAKADMRAEARRKAVGAARDKAALYAEAAGTRLGPVVHIDDVDPESAGAELYRGHRFGSGDASAEDLAPGHVVVSAAVIVGFSLIHG